MKKCMMTMLLLASCSAVQAAGSASASIDVSFVIRAACTVQAGGADGAAPQVACSQGAAYRLQHPAQEGAARPEARQQAPSSAARAGDAWQVVF